MHLVNASQHQLAAATKGTPKNQHEQRQSLQYHQTDLMMKNIVLAFFFICQGFNTTTSSI